MEPEELIIKVTVLMNKLKCDINPSLDNKFYQEWTKRNELDKNYKFTHWVIEDYKKEIIELLDKQY